MTQSGHSLDIQKYFLNLGQTNSVFRWLQFAWAIIGVGVCFSLAMLKGGHPPGLVFVPFAAAIWVVGHVFLWLVHKLAIRRKCLSGSNNIDRAQWPVMLPILVILSGIILIIGTLGLASFFI